MTRATIITAVHGTWAKGAPWTQENSPLMAHLGDNIPGDVVLDRFDWSGANRQSARLASAEELVLHIKCVRREHPPNSNHFLVAHSHGGNVAALACKDETIAKHISGVICLNTPFLYFRRTGNLLTYVGATIAFFVAALALQGTLQLATLSPLPIALWTIVLLLSFAVLTARIVSPVEETQRSSLDTSLKNNRWLILKSVGDEANGVLAGAAFANWLVTFVIDLFKHVVGQSDSVEK